MSMWSRRRGYPPYYGGYHDMGLYSSRIYGGYGHNPYDIEESRYTGRLICSGCDQRESIAYSAADIMMEAEQAPCFNPDCDYYEDGMRYTRGYRGGRQNEYLGRSHGGGIGGGIGGGFGGSNFPGGGVWGGMHNRFSPLASGRRGLPGMRAFLGGRARTDQRMGLRMGAGY